MKIESSRKLSFKGVELDTGPNQLGELRRTESVADVAVRMAEDGYVYLPGYLGREAALDARRVLTGHLFEQGMLDPGYLPEEAIIKPGVEFGFEPAATIADPAFQSLLYRGRMIALYETMLGGPILSFNYTWMRLQPPGGWVTPPHCDLVFMGRGTHRLYTAWTPLGTIPVGAGGLMLLEGSHRQTAKLRDYLDQDADSYCLNAPDQKPNSVLSEDPAALQRDLGGRWLTTQFEPGDVLTFSMATVHMSVDNHSEHIRLSTDSRYQLASEPADHRWVGPQPIGHGDKARRGLIC